MRRPIHIQYALNTIVAATGHQVIGKGAIAVSASSMLTAKILMAQLILCGRCRPSDNLSRR